MYTFSMTPVSLEISKMTIIFDTNIGEIKDTECTNVISSCKCEKFVSDKLGEIEFV